MADYIAYITVRVLNFILGFVPINASLWLGRQIGRLAFFFNKKRRLIAYANLKAAFAKEKPPKELKAITKRVYQNLVQTFVEILNLTKVNRRYVDSYVEVVNMDRIQNAAKSGRGTILLTGHFGDWELSSLVSSVEGFPIMVLAREQKMKRLNELLNRLRESNGCKVIRKGISTKSILRALYEKNIVGILSDQDAGKSGVFVDFFGRPVSCHSGPFEIAQRTNSLVLPNFIVRTKGACHKLFLEEYIDLKDLSSSKEDIKQGVSEFTGLLESYIRKYPDQWLWLHKRWKSTPVRTVLVLDDGKAGHLNQSMAIAEDIRKARMVDGYKPEDIRITVVRVKFKSPWARSLLGVSASFASWRCHGCMKCMKACLDEDTYETLMKTYSDFVISCGSSLAGVNIFMSKENNAKNIVVMRPGIFMGLNKFKLALIPEHDRPAQKRNVVRTVLAPNLINEEKIRKDGELLSRRVHLGTNGAVGVFIGGDNPEYAFTDELALSVAQSLTDFCDKSGAGILMTTSRRTPKEVEELFKKRSKSSGYFKLLVVANEKNPPETVGGVLDLSRVILVSGESISMISEAVSSGKPVVVFRLTKKKPGTTKHERALAAFEKRGYVTVCDAGHIASTLLSVWNTPRPARRTDDNERIFEAVRRLI
ncbi:MAG: ELM1/GtrOC1 family putative glycosyltransferase [Candidatus Omnitrophica bacterium]|nr:ELM1/GtrOC1 family putative glycosyltransferase [Candidatus Omnitrophota bacterium]